MTAFSSNYLDYIFIVIPATGEINRTTEDFFNYGKNLINFNFLANNMNIPVIAIITKIDLISENEKQNLIKKVKNAINNLKINKVPLIMETDEDIVLFSRNINENIIPIFMVSNIQWNGLKLFKSFLSMLPVNSLQHNSKLLDEEMVEVIIINK